MAFFVISEVIQSPIQKPVEGVWSNEIGSFLICAVLVEEPYLLLLSLFREYTTDQVDRRVEQGTGHDIVFAGTRGSGGIHVAAPNLRCRDSIKYDDVPTATWVQTYTQTGVQNATRVLL